MLREVLDGLSRCDKRLPCKFFYDARGSQLFEQICELPEYYLTRTELQIMESAIGPIRDAVGSRVRLVEFGSGSSTKTRMLLEQLRDPACYVPVDIAEDMLRTAVAALRARFPRLPVQPLAADYTQPFTLPPAPPGTARTVCYFPGSTIGNFERDEAVAFLANTRRICGKSGGFLVGVDLRKDPGVILPAYNDSAGVTGEFNRNVLRHCNAALGADFDVDAFAHRAIWNDEQSRIEMQLVSRRDQRVHLAGREFRFVEGEVLTTEFSHKWSLAAFREIASGGGFDVEHVWVDRSGWFSVQLLRTA